jgi:hypothetical protein
MRRAIQNWRIEKPVATSRHGVVVSQNATAADVGASIYEMEATRLMQQLLRHSRSQRSNRGIAGLVALGS